MRLISSYYNKKLHITLIFVRSKPRAWQLLMSCPLPSATKASDLHKPVTCKLVLPRFLTGTPTSPMSFSDPGGERWGYIYIYVYMGMTDLYAKFWEGSLILPLSCWHLILQVWQHWSFSQNVTLPSFYGKTAGKKDWLPVTRSPFQSPKLPTHLR